MIESIERLRHLGGSSVAADVHRLHSKAWAMDPALAEKAEKALFDLEARAFRSQGGRQELKLRLAAGRCGDHRHGPPHAPEVGEPPSEVSRRRVLDLETALQLAILHPAKRPLKAPEQREVQPERPVWGTQKVMGLL